MANEQLQIKPDTPFVFEINDTTSEVVENFEKKDTSIFQNIYNGIFPAIKNTLETYELNKDKNKENPNNIFAIIGDRGAGKTSCMKSIALMLSENNKVEHSVFANFDDNSFQKKSFEVIESTDPSFFNKNKNILDIVLGRLFSRFEEEVQRNQSNNINKKNTVLQNFENVKHSLASMEKNVCEDDCVNQLIDLSASVDLKKYIGELIDSFLDYIGKDYLVIPVDDIDLHTLYAFDMAEQIRKYLAQPRTIVLMALKIEQLEYAIVRHYLDHYKMMLDQKIIHNSNVTDMAVKYLIKLIPQSHRFPLISIQDLLNEKIEIKNNKNIVTQKKHTLKEIIIDLIFEKTHLSFSTSSKDPNLIIPNNLRECRYLLEFLIQMGKYSTTRSGKYNQQKFITHLINYCEKSLTSDDISFLKNLTTNISARNLNKYIINYLSSKLEQFTDPSEPLYRRRVLLGSRINRIISLRNSPYNVSCGDLVAFLQYFESRIFQESDTLFTFAIKTLYSILLDRAYNEKENNKKSIDDKINYDSIVGGTFISESDSGINSHFSSNIIYKCNRQIRRIISINSLKDNLKDALDSKGNIKDLEKFNTIEFFALTISRAYTFNNDESFRTKIDPVYTAEFPNDNPYVWFDIFSLFTNITHIEQSYNRIDPNLYKIAQKNPKSLFSLMRKTCLDLKQKNADKNIDGNQAFSSCSCIRNFDDLEKIRYNLINSTQTEDNGIDTIENILVTICPNIKLENNENDLYHEINFNFIEVLYNFLSSQKTKSTFNNIYENISNQTLNHFNKLNQFTQGIALLTVLNKKSDPQKIKENVLTSIKIYIANLNYSNTIIEDYIHENLEDIDVKTLEGAYKFARTYNTFIDWLKTLPVIA